MVNEVSPPSRKSKVMVVGKREARVCWKIDEEIVEEVEVFMHSGVWVDGSYM